jgi:S-adenosylmethionine:diacylglycerol 3-amino-3-carboxypropyl transferase
MEVSSTAPETAWESGRFNARPGPHKLLFGRMYEDAAIELRAFPPGGHLFCIASAGCTAMKLAARHQVVAVDINPVQLAYVKRRLASAAVQLGSADRILAFLRALGPLAGWSRRRVRAFMDLDNPAEQILYWHRHLDTRRFRAAFDLLFSRPALRSMYSASFLDRLPPNFGAVMRGRMERCFTLHSNRTNPYARALFLGEISCSNEEATERGEIQLVCADAAAFLERQPAGSFTGFSLSNILDGANPTYERRLVAAVQRAAAPGALAVLRSFREPASLMQSNHATEDRSMLWGIVEIRPANTL